MLKLHDLGRLDELGDLALFVATRHPRNGVKLLGRRGQDVRGPQAHDVPKIFECHDPILITDQIGDILKKDQLERIGRKRRFGDAVLLDQRFDNGFEFRRLHRGVKLT